MPVCSRLPYGSRLSSVESSLPSVSASLLLFLAIVAAGVVACAMSVLGAAGPVCRHQVLTASSGLRALRLVLLHETEGRDRQDEVAEVSSGGPVQGQSLHGCSVRQCPAAPEPTAALLTALTSG